MSDILQPEQGARTGAVTFSDRYDEGGQVVMVKSYVGQHRAHSRLSHHGQSLLSITVSITQPPRRLDATGGQAKEPPRSGNPAVNRASD